MKCKYIFNYLKNIYSSNNNKIDITEKMIEFFEEYFINTEHNPEKDVTIRFFLSLLKIYIDANNKFDKSLLKSWSNEIKPYVDQKYPVSKQGLFNTNSDLHYFIQIINDSAEKYKLINIEEEKKNNSTNIIKNNKNGDTQIKTPETETDIKIIKNSKSCNKTTESETDIKNNNLKKELKNKIQKSKIYEEEDIKILRKKNMTKISMFLEEFIQQNTIKRKRTNSMINLRPHSQTIASATTCDDSTCLEDTNININQLIESNNDIIKKNSIKKFDEYLKNSNIVEKENTKEINRTLIRSKTQSLLGGINPKYFDEEELVGKNIKYIDQSNKLSFILVDLLLKKIIFEDFINKNILIIYHFCNQCFCFINKEIFFRKLVNCYKYYEKKNLGLDKLKNLIEFMNILIIEMFEYYQKIDYKNKYVSIIKSFYYELINDLLTNYSENEKEKKINNEQKDDNNNGENTSNDLGLVDLYSYENIDNNTINKNINDCNLIIDKKNLIKMDLHTESQNIKIFFMKDNKKEKETKKTSNKNKSNLYNNFKEDKKQNMKTINYNINIPNMRNTISFNPNVLPTTKKEDDECEEEDVLKSKRDEAKQEKQKEYQIFRTLRRSERINLKYISKINTIIEDIKEENNEDDKDNEKNQKKKDITNVHNNSHNNSDTSSDDSDEENYEENIKEKTKEEEKEKLEEINNLLDKTFSSKKLLTEKDDILYQIKFILYLIDIKNEDEIPSILDIRDAKESLPFYNLLNNLIKQKNKKIFNLPQKRLTKTNVITYKNSIFSRFQDNKRVYLNKGYFCIIDWKTEEIGDKLTEITKKLLNRISPRELYRGVFLKKDKDITSKNVVECINSFNKLTSFIIEDILSFDTPKERAKIYDKWLQIADYLKNKKNYNDCIAIYSALNNYIITGLKLTLKELKTKTKNMFEQISNFCSCEGNYRNIREDMNLCQKKGETFVPYLGMLLRDINFLEESSKYLNENGCINIEKIEKINKIMETYFKYKTESKKLNNNNQPIKELDFLEKLEDIPEIKLEEIANNIEPIFKYENQKGKRLTNIDKKYFKKEVNKRLSVAIPLNRNTISIRTQSSSYFTNKKE